MSLATATLANCVLLWGLYAVLAYALLAAAIRAAAPEPLLTLADLAIEAMGAAVYVWGAVGAWRSADRHLLETGERIWPALAKAFLFATAIVQLAFYGGMAALLLVSRLAS